MACRTYGPTLGVRVSVGKGINSLINHNKTSLAPVGSSNPHRPPTEAIEKQQCFLRELIELLDPMLCTRHGMRDRITDPNQLPRFERRELTGHSAHQKPEASRLM